MSTSLVRPCVNANITTGDAKEAAAPLLLILSDALGVGRGGGDLELAVAIPSRLDKLEWLRTRTRPLGDSS